MLLNDLSVQFEQVFKGDEEGMIDLSGYSYYKLDTETTSATTLPAGYDYLIWCGGYNYHNGEVYYNGTGFTMLSTNLYSEGSSKYPIAMKFVSDGKYKVRYCNVWRKPVT